MAWITILKYFGEKNRQIYERRLNEVYAPLYGLVVRQEKYRQLFIPNHSFEEVPVLTSESVQTKVSFEFKKDGISVSQNESTTVGFLDRKQFLNILNDTNMGLARPRLLELIHQYHLLIYLEENAARESDHWKKATSEKVSVEIKLVQEILEGYMQTLKKLGIDKEIDLEIKL